MLRSRFRKSSSPGGSPAKRRHRGAESYKHLSPVRRWPELPSHEFVEGETLKGPIPLKEAVPIIHQLIDGIEIAHEHNIVHRDLKPANLKITPEGILKILDFGLAKAVQGSAAPASAGEAAENSPTLTIGITQAGTILGTAAYRSSEQARGKTPTAAPTSGRSAQLSTNC